ncbi:uncharacterized protein MYCGRDRAFT_29926, partial [Zymoseptoria tritici IPO323]
ESPLDNANFLSFEEWKKQNLAKMGQSPEDLQRAQQINANRQRPGDPSVTDSVPASAAGQQLAASPTLRSKDAGKTCKERTNYASFDCAATILKSNKECKSASSVLVENKDSYMLNICSADNKFFIVELCDDIQIDTVVLANYEFFSSSFRHFKVSVSDRYPVKLEKWRDLGTFEARNTREIQAFLVQNPLIWARYLRIEFLTHYGTEYYCPVSVLRVHGTTMWEDYRHQEELARGEEDELVLEAEVEAVPPVAQEPLASTVEDPKSTVHTTPPSVTKGPPTTQNNTSSMNTTRPAAAATSTTAPAPPQPSSQESFFKSFHKRLQQLESNSTLSLQYIEEQSRILRDAFTKVEKRQLSTTTKFLSTLNSTVMAELQNYRLAYDQLWQSTVIELEGQRESYQDDMLALSRRLTMVADELVWQKRMGIVQSTLLLLCLALVLFGRN